MVGAWKCVSKEVFFFLNGSALEVTVISFGWETMECIVLPLWISQVAVLRPERVAREL